MIASTKENLVFATGLLNDQNEVKVLDMADIDVNDSDNDGDLDVLINGENDSFATIVKRAFGQRRKMLIKNIFETLF